MFKKVHKQYIHLADNEWGSPLMREIAKDWLVMHRYLIRDDEHILCCVYEHAGWALSFTLSAGGEVMCVGSVNGYAQYPAEEEQWRQAAYHAKHEQVEYPIRRPVPPATRNTIVLPTTVALSGVS